MSTETFCKDFLPPVCVCCVLFSQFVTVVAFVIKIVNIYMYTFYTLYIVHILWNIFLHGNTTKLTIDVLLHANMLNKQTVKTDLHKAVYVCIRG